MASKGQSQENESKDNAAEIDKELDALLDSALEDFGDGKKPAKAEKKAAESSAEAPKAPTSSTDDSLSDMFTEEFSEEMAKQFEDAMKSFMADDPSMLQQIEKMAEAAGSAGDSAESGKEFKDTLKQTLSSLAQNTENLQDHAAPAGAGLGGAAGGINPEEMMKMFSGMGLEGPDPDEGFMPMMQGMMKTLLSKDVLYPSLKEIADKYPDWLKENEGKVSDAEHQKYSKQFKIIKDILMEFENEKETDSDDVKKKRFDCIMDLMQRMQDLGQPPSAIVGDMAPGLDFDANGVPKFPGSPESCAVM